MRISNIIIAPLALVSTLLVGCDPVTTADLEVKVAADVVAAYDAESPGAVVVEGGPFDTLVLGVLCDPDAGELSFQHELSHIGCAEEGMEVHAWIVPVPAVADGLCDLHEEERIARVSDADVTDPPNESDPQAYGEIDFGELPEKAECPNGAGSVVLEIL